MMSVMRVAMNVIKDKTNGNIPLVDHESLDASNCQTIPTVIKLDVAKTIISIIILPMKPAIIHHRALMAISESLIFFGQNDMSIIC